MNLLEDNQRFIDKLEKDNNLKQIRDDLFINGQHPSILVITCSDSRVVPEIIFDKFLGELFVIRTAGNVINSGELATIEYAIEHLKVKEVIVLGHTHCGAIHASIHNETSKYMDPILKRIKANIGDITDEVEASKINALKEVDYIKNKFPNYKGKIDYLIYDIKTSNVSK